MNHLFIQGPPRSGKTFLINRILPHLTDVSGFLTKEVTKDGKRTGFDCVSLNSNISIKLARIGDKPPKVGNYSVFVDEFDKFLKESSFNSTNVVLDEIGKMELLSENFIEMINQIFNHSNIIATIPVRRISIIDGLIKKYRPTIVQITKASSIKAFNEVIGWLTLNKLIKSDQNNFK